MRFCEAAKTATAFAVLAACLPTPRAAGQRQSGYLPELASGCAQGIVEREARLGMSALGFP